MEQSKWTAEHKLEMVVRALRRKLCERRIVGRHLSATEDIGDLVLPVARRFFSGHLGRLEGQAEPAEPGAGVRREPAPEEDSSETGADHRHPKKLFQSEGA